MNLCCLNLVNILAQKNKDTHTEICQQTLAKQVSDRYGKTKKPPPPNKKDNYPTNQPTNQNITHLHISTALHNRGFSFIYLIMY